MELFKKSDILKSNLITSGLYFYLYNELSTITIKKTSATTQSVANTAKRVIVIVGVRRGPLAALDYTWRWGALSALPFFAWHAWAFATFAWEAPNTYFAKLHDGGRFAPWAWAGNKARSWGYLRRCALWYGHGFLLWLYLFGQSGFKGWRAGEKGSFSENWPHVYGDELCGSHFRGDDAAVLAPSSGDGPAAPRHRASVASMAWRSTRRLSMKAP